ncbi:MAG: dimethylarginine dimethylaminohydrolase [Acidobacteriota bacterium]
MVFRHAIARSPCRAIVRGLSTAGLGEPDYGRAVEQHREYLAALRSCGLNLTVLPSIEEYPDSVFVEDTAVCTPYCAVVSRPGAPSRRGEAELIAPVLSGFYSQVERIVEPGTLDAGDVMVAGSHCFVGLSSRTNEAGAAQLIAILEQYGMSGSTIPVEAGLHLKSSVAYLGEGRVLGTRNLLSLSEFRSYRRIEVPDEEAYASNCIWVNGRIIMPAGHPMTRSRIGTLGCPVIEVDTSEFRKLDGGVSCLSLRF